MTEDRVEFGFPDFAATVFAEHGPALRLAYEHSHLANKLIGALSKEMNLNQVVINMLVRMTTTGWVELLMLVGNGAGLGAMKIARGMFETAVMAEYLRQTPEEIDDYIEYGHVLDSKRIKMFPEAVSPEKAREIEEEYNRVRPRFENKDGKVRGHWNRHSISYMAHKIGRGEQYEIPYSLAASIHHGNFEAMIAHISGDETQIEIESPPSLQWVNQALVSGHVYLLQALNTLNTFFDLGFDLELAGNEFENVWRKAATSAASGD
jgi:uncharacterized protein DUF5677